MSLLGKDLKQSKKLSKHKGLQQQYVETVCDGISLDMLGSAHEKATKLIAEYEAEDYNVTHLSTVVDNTSSNDRLFITLVFTRK